MVQVANLAVDGVRDVTETNAADADTDDDALADSEEQGVLHPLDADFDDDLLNDGQEAGRTMGIPGGTSGGGATSLPHLGTAVGWTPDGNPATRTDPVDADLQAGDGSASWGRRDRHGLAVPSGIYLAKLETPTGTRSVKETLAR